MWMMYKNKPSTREKNLILETKKDIKGQQTPSRNFSQQQHEQMPSNSFCNPWQNDSTLTNSLHHGKESSADKRVQGTSKIGINCKPYKINMKRHGKYSFTKTGDDKLHEVETLKERKQERGDSLHNCCQTPSDWKEPTKYDINNLLQDASTDKLYRSNDKPSCNDRNNCYSQWKLHLNNMIEQLE